MAKLGYTWYPKDWGNSDGVFELTLIERGLYRELIDMAMLNDNINKINIKTWARKFGSSENEIQNILTTLENLQLIELKEDTLFIPSCESRLNLVRGGRNGGKKSKPTIKPILKPTSKPVCKQIEIEKKIEKKIEIESIKEYFSENGYTQESAIKFFNYYSVANWNDAKGNKVKNWKQKAQSVWFKPENKIQIQKANKEL